MRATLLKHVNWVLDYLAAHYFNSEVAIRGRVNFVCTLAHIRCHLAIGGDHRFGGLLAIIHKPGVFAARESDNGHFLGHAAFPSLARSVIT